MKLKNMFNYIRILLAVTVMLGSMAGFQAIDAYAEEYVVKEEQPVEEVQLVVEDCDFMSKFIYQQGGFSSVEDYAVMTMSAEEDADAGDVEGAKEKLLAGMENMEAEVDLRHYQVTTNEITAVVAGVLNENPNLFYATPETISYDENTQYVQSVAVSYDIVRASEYEEALQAAYDEAITDPFGMNDLQKARALHDWIVQHVSYDHSLSNYDAYDAIVSRSAVCQGYTLAYAALLEKAGIEVDYCRSSAMNHIWNYVKIDGNWYHVDTTWDDPSWGSGSDDRTGYVRHTFFLNSDTKIQQPASGSSDTHHSWTGTKTCSSTTYDNAWWQDEVSAIFVIDGKEYYLRLTSQSYKIQLICRTGNTEKVLYSKSVKWYAWNSNSYYYTTYSTLSYFKGRLYFNDPLNIYVINPGDTSPTTLYTYNGGQGYIYGCLVCGEGETYTGVNYRYLHILITKNTDGLGEPYYWNYPTEAIQNAKITAEPAELPYGYTTSSVLTAGVEKNFVGTPTYQWYKVTRDSSGIATATAISGATGATYTLPMGLSEGLHFYRVKISMDGVTLPADITIKVGEVKGTISNKDYPLNVVYDGMQLEYPSADHFVTNAGALSFEWYKGEERLGVPPTDAGTYRLHVMAEEAEYATAAEADFTVTVQKRPITIGIKDATITYGDNLPGTFEEQFPVDGLVDFHRIRSLSYNMPDYVTESEPASVAVEEVEIYDSFTQEDVTYNYEPDFVAGKIIVLPREITIKADDQIIYKGQELVSTKISVTSGSLPNNFYVIEAVLEASTEEVTTNGVITIADVVIKGWGGDDPTSYYGDETANFIIKTETGNLTIEDGGFGTADLYRIYGQNRYETSFKIAEAYKQFLGVEQFQAIVVASGKNFPDALAGSYLAGVRSAPILMTNGKNSADIVQYVVENLKRGGTVYVLGGDGAVPDSLYSELVNNVKGIVKRLSGKTRYETNLRILREVGVSGKDIIVCTGRGFADSLSASATGLPIFLVGKELTDAQREYLSYLDGNHLYIVGGTGAVSAEIEDELNAYGNVTRISGTTRYETSIAVAETFFENPTAAVLASAKKFPDGLCGGPLAYSRSVPLILTADGKEAEAAAYAASKNIKYGAVLGGTGVLKNGTVKKVIAANKIVEW